MALAFTINFTVRDQKGKSSPCKLRVPTSVSIPNLITFSQSAMQLVANANKGTITNCGISVNLDLSGAGLNTVISAFADVGEKALFTFKTAISGLFAKFKLPTFSENANVIAGTDQIDTTATAVAAFIAGCEDGIDIGGGTFIQPQDKYGNDVTQAQVTREIFADH